MYERGYIVGYEGNLSIRLDADRILITPTCMNKGKMSPGDLVIMDMKGHHRPGDCKVSSEESMHLLFYRMRPDVRAVCHGHPATATGFAVAGQSLDHAFLPELAVTFGRIALLRCATPGAPELGADIESHVPHYDALLLANYGAVTCGPDLVAAFTRMEILEHCAKTVLNTHLVGEPRSFSSRGPAKLLAPHLRYLMPAPRGSIAALRETCRNANDASEEVTLTRAELNALVDEAVRKDRALWKGLV
jgi:L-fuculose-phosphate aldolase